MRHVCDIPSHPGTLTFHPLLASYDPQDADLFHRVMEGSIEGQGLGEACETSFSPAPHDRSSASSSSSSAAADDTMPFTHPHDRPSQPAHPSIFLYFARWLLRHVPCHALQTLHPETTTTATAAATDQPSSADIAVELAAAVRYKSHVARVVTAWVRDHGLYAVAALLGLPRAARDAARWHGRGPSGPSDPPEPHLGFEASAVDLPALLSSHGGADLTFMRSALAAPLLELRALDAARSQFSSACVATSDAAAASAGETTATLVALTGQHVEALLQLLSAVQRELGPGQWDALRINSAWVPVAPVDDGDAEPVFHASVWGSVPVGGDGSDGGARGDREGLPAGGMGGVGWQEGCELQHLRDATTMEELNFFLECRWDEGGGDSVHSSIKRLKPLWAALFEYNE